MHTKIRKGIAINSILIMTGALLFAGLIGQLYTESPLAEAMLQGSGLVEKEVDYTVEIENRQQLSDLAELSFDRARNDGCAENGHVAQQNENGGYPGLSDSYLTSTPDCYGADSSILRGADAASGRGGQQQGQDMEGIYSREKFEISENIDSGITLKTDPKGNSDLWLENNLLVAANEPYESRVPQECDQNFADDIVSSITGLKPISKITDTLPIIDSTGDIVAAHIGSPNYIIYFEQEASDDRTTEWLSHEMSDGAYCGQAIEGTSDANLNAPVHNIYKQSQYRLNDGKSVEITLCPGDKGYVQVNKDHPHVDGEAGEDMQSKAWKFPRIVVTETGEECGNFDTQIPEGENSKGNILRINVNIEKGWKTVGDVDLHQVSDSKTFNEGTSQETEVSPESDRCMVYVRERDPRNTDDNGGIYYRTGSIIGHSAGESFPNFEGGDVYTGQSWLDSEAGDSGKWTIGDKPLAADTIYRGTEADDIDGLEATGFTGTELNNNIKFLKNVKASKTVFEPYGDLLCFQPSGASRAKWMVCDESNYESSSVTVEAERGDIKREYKCTPATGEWERQIEDSYTGDPRPGP